MSAPEHEAPILEVTDLVVDYPGQRGKTFRAVDGVSFRIRAGETLGLVGESGSGKSTIGRAILGLAPVTQGSIRFDGQEIGARGLAKRRGLSESLQVVFQDPYSSLDPTKTIGYTLAEPLLTHGRGKSSARKQVDEMLDRIGLRPPDALRYPAGFSGGQRQRIAIARALMLEPRLVVCHEPVSALDLSVQAQIVNLMIELQRERSLSYLFIAHDLTIVRHMSHNVVVLNKGEVVEQGEAKVVYDHPQHPYTRALLDAAPVPDPAQQRLRREQRRQRQADRPNTTGGHADPISDTPSATTMRSLV